VLSDFSGGINARRDRVNMSPNESPMTRNIEWHGRGGFSIRKGLGPLLNAQRGEVLGTNYGTNTGGGDGVGSAYPVVFYHYLRDPQVITTFQSIYVVYLANGRVVICLDSGALPTGADATPGEWTVLTIGGTPIAPAGAPSFVGWQDKCYISPGSQLTNGTGKNWWRFDGTTVATVAMGKAFNENYAAPTGGNLPAARFGAAFAERFWTAVQVSDAGVVQGSRVRWSHPGSAEDWATLDYVDVGQQGDTITGLAAMRDMLVVFKNSSMYAVLGSGATNFRVIEISGAIGCTGQWTRDDQGGIVFWDPTIGLCRFDGSAVKNLFAPIVPMLQDRLITRCSGVATDGERIFVLTDFSDVLGDRVAAPAWADIIDPNSLIPDTPPTLAAGPGFSPDRTPWDQLPPITPTWAQLAAFRWSMGTNMIMWVGRRDLGWTAFSASHPSDYLLTMIGQLRSRFGAYGDLESNRRVVIGHSGETWPILMTDRYDDGYDNVGRGVQVPIDSWYMTAWLHGGLPAQIKRWKAPRVIQEADDAGALLVDVYYDFNNDSLRRTLRIDLPVSLSADSFSVSKPGTIGRAKATMLVVRPEHPRHWGISSVNIPLHPKVLR
jgi:hypothetical protein